MVERASGERSIVAECGRASGERRAATDASPQAASPQLNSLEEEGDWDVWVEVAKSSTASTDTQSNDGNESIHLDGFDMQLQSM